MSTEFNREWRRLGRELLEAGIITQLDRTAFAALVQSYVHWIKAQEGIKETGLLIRGPDGAARVNPLLRVSRDAQAEFTRMLGEFGMTPASRTRVATLKEPEVDEFEDLLQGPRLLQ